MDKQTQIMWEAEFVKQYPKPDYEILGVEELVEINRILFEAKHPEIMETIQKSLDLTDYRDYYQWSAATEKHRREVYDTVEIRCLLGRQERAMQPWENWKKECYDRFDAIFSAEPTYALLELRKGNLLIEGNV